MQNIKQFISGLFRKSNVSDTLCSTAGTTVGSLTEYGSYEYQGLLREGDTKNSFVSSGVNLICDSVSSVNYKLVEVNKDGTYTDLPNHPLNKLIKNPNNEQSQKEFIFVIASHLILAGSSYFARLDSSIPLNQPQVAADSNAADELYTLQPDRILTEVSSSGITRFKYTSTRFGIINYVNDLFARDSARRSMVKVLRCPSKSEELMGKSPLSACSFEINITNQISIFLDSAFKRGLSASFILGVNTNDQSELVRLKQEVLDRYTGAANAGAPLVTNREIVTNKLGTVIDSADILKIRNELGKAIYLALGIPPVLLSIDGTTFNNQESATVYFWINTVSKYCEKIASGLTDFLCPLYGDNLKIVPDYSKVPAMLRATAEATNSIAETASKLQNVTFISEEEKRHMLGLSSKAK